MAHQRVAKREIDFSKRISSSSTSYNAATQNPFQNYTDYPVTTTDYIKVGLGCLCLVPTRILLYGFFAFTMAFSSFLGVSYHNYICRKSGKDPLTTPMSNSVLPFKKITQYCFRGLLFSFGFLWINVKGKQASASEAPILVAAPHSTVFDFFFLGYSNFPSAVSRKENADTPVIGYVVRMLQPISVDRMNNNSRKDTIQTIVNRATSRGVWPQLVIFPEGTTTNGKCLITFKKGAFLGQPVQPVLLRFKSGRIDPSWTFGGPGLMKNLLYLMARPFNQLEVEFLPVYKPNLEEQSDSHMFCLSIRRLMSEKLKVPTTGHSVEDVKLVAQAISQEMPMESGLIEYMKLHDSLGINFDEISELLKRFKEMDQNEDGLISFEEFASYLKLPPSIHVKTLFDTYDRDGTGKINFRKYLVGLKMVSSSAMDENSIEYAFQIFDADGDGKIDHEEFFNAMRSTFPNMSKRDINSLFSEVDADANGYLSIEEFRNFAEEHPEYKSIFQFSRL